MDRVQKAVAAFESGEKTLAALEGFVGALLRSEVVSPDAARAALRDAVERGTVPVESLRRLHLADAAQDVAPVPTVVTSDPPIAPPSGEPYIAAVRAAPASSAAATLFRPQGLRTGPAAPVERDGTGSTWIDPSARQPDTQIGVGTLLGGRYLLERVLGEGGMGVVYYASDQEVKGEFFAIKVLKPAIREYPEALVLLREEVRRTRSLGHPNIVGVYSLNSDRASVYMIMEYLEGKTVGELIDESFGRGMPFRRAWPLIDDMCAALAYAHDQSIIHSDIKTSNIFIMFGGKAKLLDFGIARAARGRRNRPNTVGLGALTPTYASCEMLEGREPDARDDIYSLACVIYEMLSGRHPFGDQTAVEARDGKRIPAPLDSLSSAQNAALARALAFDREKRTASVEALLAGLSPTAPGAAGAANDSRAAKRKTAVLVAGGVLVVAVLALSLTWSRLFPSASVKDRAAAVEAQTAVSESMIRIEASRRRIDDRLRDARSQVDRLTDRLNVARNNAEQESLRKQLAEAQTAATAAQRVNDLADKGVFSVEKLAALRDKHSAGEADLQTAQFGQAAQELAAARRMADAMLAAAVALPTAVDAQAALATLTTRARAAVEAGHGDAVAALARSSAMARQAGEALAASDAVNAVTLFAAATAAVNRDVQTFLDRGIAALAAIAQKKLAADELDSAQDAISQAEALQKLKGEFH